MFWRYLKRRIHPSWVITLFCYMLSVGVFFSKFNSNFSSLVFLILSIVLITVALFKNRLFIIPLVVIGGLLSGLWRGSLVQDRIKSFEPYYGQKVLMRGLISNKPDLNSSGKLSIQFSVEQIDGKNLRGDVWLTTYSISVNQGDEAEFSGTLQKGFGNFVGIIYGANLEKIILKNSDDLLANFRDSFSKSIENSVGETESKLGIGFLLGQRKNLPTNFILSLQIVGLTHIVVASGYNLTILVRLARRIFEKASKYLSALFSFSMIVGFILITGLSPSMSRAGFVALISLLAWYYGRKFHPLTLLALAIAATLIFNPSYVWGDIGWQLSFTSFAGVMIIAPLLQRYLFGDKKPGSIRQIFGETVAAQIATLPIIILAFGQFSNISVLANLLILPFVPLVMLLVFIAGLGGLILPGLAVIIGFPAKLLLDYMISAVNWLAEIPWASSRVNLSIGFAAVYYLLLILLCVYLVFKTKYKLRDTNLVE